MSRPSITKANPYTPGRGRFAGRTFQTERQYRNALAKAKGFKDWDAQRRAVRRVRSLTDIAKLRPSARAKREQALHVVSLGRRYHLPVETILTSYNRGKPREERISLEAVQKYAPGALERRDGQTVVRPFDRVTRVMLFLTPDGRIALTIRDSRTATRIGRYWNAVKLYLETGDESVLRPFRGKSLRVDKMAYPYLTDPAILMRLATAGEVRFDSIYETLEAA